MISLDCYDIAYNKCKNEKIKEKILLIKNKHRELLKKEKKYSSMILENRIRRGKKIQKVPSVFREEMSAENKESVSFLNSFRDSCLKLSFQQLLSIEADIIKFDLDFEKSLLSQLNNEDQLLLKKIIDIRQELISLIAECISDENLQ